MKSDKAAARVWEKHVPQNGAVAQQACCATAAAGQSILVRCGEQEPMNLNGLFGSAAMIGALVSDAFGAVVAELFPAYLRFGAVIRPCPAFSCLAWQRLDFVRSCCSSALVTMKKN
ncbi:hypothetical protein [Bradyrhizobium prioriisuperbiae]|uniref:hypothetical protein n=1 Tax=Bradyrhizobium prioriisuperbiae TaxID=2854389 RepID=UPI0028E5402F|nr:hypothetical protein [Bradyrhizobium prioritasuperba]